MAEPVLITMTPSFKNTNAFFLILLIVITISFLSPIYMSHAEEDTEFFSYERFFLPREIIDNMRGNNLMKMELSKFAANFNSGIYHMSSGEFVKAEKELLEARKIWPEYFGPDFLLAMVYENNGEYKKAAEYYKSYLKKLKNLHSGNYRISEALIRGLQYKGVERYPEAYALVESRMSYYDIDIKKVRPAMTAPHFLFPLFIGALIAGIYAAMHFKVMPYLKKMERVKNPPEGFWTCPNCGVDNAEPVKECEECRRPRTG